MWHKKVGCFSSSSLLFSTTSSSLPSRYLFGCLFGAFSLCGWDTAARKLWGQICGRSKRIFYTIIHGFPATLLWFSEGFLFIHFRFAVTNYKSEKNFLWIWVVVERTATYSVHSFSAVSSLFMVCELISIMAAAVGEASLISDNAATAFATTWKYIYYNNH